MLKKTKRKNKASIYGNKALGAQESSHSISVDQTTTKIEFSLGKHRR